MLRDAGTAGTRDRIGRLAGHRLAADRRRARLSGARPLRLVQGRPLGRDFRRQGLVWPFARQPQPAPGRCRAPSLAAALVGHPLGPAAARLARACATWLHSRLLAAPSHAATAAFRPLALEHGSLKLTML